MGIIILVFWVIMLFWFLMLILYYVTFRTIYCDDVQSFIHTSGCGVTQQWTSFDMSQNHRVGREREDHLVQPLTVQGYAAVPNKDFHPSWPYMLLLFPLPLPMIHPQQWRMNLITWHETVGTNITHTPTPQIPLFSMLTGFWTIFSLKATWKQVAKLLQDFQKWHLCHVTDYIYGNAEIIR